MQVRNRLRTKVYTGSRRERFSPYTVNTNSYVSLSESCEDVTGDGAGDNQPLTIERTTRSGGLISGGGTSHALTGYTWFDYPCAYVEDSYLTSHLSISGQPSNSLLVSQMLARTQPFRAETVAWEYMEDLAGLGGLARDEMGRRLGLLKKFIGRTKFLHLRRAAQLNLLYQFGIRPLISDIKVLMHFQHSVDKRVEEMERLYGARGLRRTVQLWSGSNVTNIGTQIIQSQGVTLTARITKSTSVSVRGHVRWRNIFPVSKTPEQMRSMAKRAILGADIDPYTAYELMPWSWFIDYFLNLGNLVKAAKNMTTITHDPVRIMQHRRTTSFSSNHSTSGSGSTKISCTPMHVEYETKERDIVFPSLQAQESILTNGQLSILGSLAVLKSL